MAFQEVRQSAFKSSSKMAIGETITGYVVGFEDGTYGKNIILQEEGTLNKITVGPSGTLKYDVKDGRIKEGILTQITRVADGFSKKANKPMSAFKVLQDPERTLGDASFDAIAPDENTPEVKAQSASGAQTSAVKAQAKKLTEAMKRN